MNKFFAFSNLAKYIYNITHCKTYYSETGQSSPSSDHCGVPCGLVVQILLNFKQSCKLSASSNINLSMLSNLQNMYTYAVWPILFI